MQLDHSDIQNEDIVLDSNGQVHAAVVLTVKFGRPPKPYFHTIGTASKSTPADGPITLLMRDGQIIGPPVLDEVTTTCIGYTIEAIDAFTGSNAISALGVSDELAPMMELLRSEQTARQSR